MQELISKIDLFDFINCFFTDSKKFERITDSAKLSNAFMLNRFLSIYFPKEIQALNTFHDVSVINALHKAMCKGSVPRWIYTKSDKIKKTKFDEYSESLKLEFCQKHNIEYKNIKDFYTMFTTYFETSMKEIKKYQEQKYKQVKNK